MGLETIDPEAAQSAQGPDGSEQLFSQTTVLMPTAAIAPHDQRRDIVYRCRATLTGAAQYGRSI